MQFHSDDEPLLPKLFAVKLLQHSSVNSLYLLTVYRNISNYVSQHCTSGVVHCIQKVLCLWVSCHRLPFWLCCYRLPFGCRLSPAAVWMSALTDCLLSVGCHRLPFECRLSQAAVWVSAVTGCLLSVGCHRLPCECRLSPAAVWVSAVSGCRLGVGCHRLPFGCRLSPAAV